MKAPETGWRLGPTCSEELAAILALNNAAVPHVNALTPEALATLVAGAELAVAARHGEGVGGFLLAFGPGSAYDSPNYRWFDARYRRFLYVDRIVVAEAARGAGLGRSLYRAAFAQAEGRPLCCEVNLRPPNEASLRFHRGLGFREVGRQETGEGEKEVMLLERSARREEDAGREPWASRNSK